MHKPSLILLTLPRQPEWLAVCAKSQEEKDEEKKEEEATGAGLDWLNWAVNLGRPALSWAKMG